MKTISWRLVVVIGVIAAACVYLLPTLKPGTWPHKKINLGLDLQGGMHLVLEVDTDKAVETRLELVAQEIKEGMKKEHVHSQGVTVENGKAIRVSVTGKEDIGKYDTFMNNEFKELRQVSRTEDGGNLVVVYDLPESETAFIKSSARDQALETIRNRIDQFGVSEPDIRKQGENRILVQLPGVKETKRAKELIGKTALLEFKLVDAANDVNTALAGSPPPGSEILYQVNTDPETQRTSEVPFLIKKRAALTGEYLTEARVQFDSQYGEPYVSIKFDMKGARIFEKVTEENVNQRLAIILDNKVYSAPVIQEKISGGEARITGRFTAEEARDLAIVLRAGALPAPVEIIEERTVGPSLGTDSINQGILSMIIGSIVVVLFMILYYRLSGLVADIALVFNIVIIGAGLAACEATLTLPGIAGIILTIGMAVDANVLIFERIREELRLGKTPRASVDAGYDRATLTILDANVTTLIVAVVLLQFGTGPVKGFAVTLILGITASLFTALIMTRLFYDEFLKRRRVAQLSI